MRLKWLYWLSNHVNYKEAGNIVLGRQSPGHTSKKEVLAEQARSGAGMATPLQGLLSLRRFQRGGQRHDQRNSRPESIGKKVISF